MQLRALRWFAAPAFLVASWVCTFGRVCSPAVGAAEGSGAAPRRSAVRAQLEVEPEHGAVRGWEVQGADFEEDFRNVWVSITVKNVQPWPVVDAKFYAELFDDEGRLSDSALFSLARSRGRQSGPLGPGGVRTLYSVSADLSTSRLPRVVRVYAVRSGDAESGQPPFSASVPIRIPVTLQATSVPAYPDWQTFWLGRLSGGLDTPVLDLALAEVDVDPTGRVTRARVIRALGAPVVAWFDEAMRHLVFRPARMDFRPRRTRTLVLARALARSWRESEPAYDPPEDPWVREYLANLPAREAPSVNVMILYPCPSEETLAPRDMMATSDTSPNCLQYDASGTQWSLGVWRPSFVTQEPERGAR